MGTELQLGKMEGSEDDGGDGHTTVPLSCALKNGEHGKCYASYFITTKNE